MENQMIVAVLLGSVLSFLLQVLKRWVTLSAVQIKGLITLIGLIYAIFIFAFDGLSLKDTLMNVGSFILANQGFFALVFNNTEVGKTLSGEQAKWDD